ncbi:MAG: DNA repair protein RecN [Fimbriimonadales bacterium]|nr:DNA repair protein RecN [Fimbriimonadales bacterium]
MLIELTAENVAIIDKETVQFGPGFTSITGETGAGKSLIVDSISLCLGDRADSTIVRSGATRAWVQAVFEVDERIKNRIAERGYAIDDGFLYIQREIAAEGRSQCRINGRLAPVGVLKEIGAWLADLHGQHDHQSLLDADNHLAILDDWIGENALTLRASVGSQFDRLSELRSRLNELLRGEREREQQLDLLRFQVEELESANLRVGEIGELEAELKRLQNAEALATELKSAATSTFEGDPSAKDLLSDAVKSLEASVAFDERLQAILDSLRTSLYTLDDAIAELRIASDTVEFNPTRLEEIAGRIDTLARLRRKYGDTEEEMLAFLETARMRKSDFENAEAGREMLESEIVAAESELRIDCDKLSTLRKTKAAEFQKTVSKELTELAMANARFETRISSKEPGPDGADEIEFVFSANKGESLKPLAKIASGGELSRVMLAIKCGMAGRGGVPTLIFDEVDAGLGGEAAAVVGKKLERLAQNYQVIVITHLPQIACRASSQIHIDKVESGGRTVARAKPLSPDDRVREIARMLSGKNDKTAEAHARELLSWM